MPDGTVITHSHLWHNNGKPINQHEHSKKELSLYALLFFHYYNNSETFHINLLFSEFDAGFFLQNEKDNSASSFITRISRAPPIKLG